MSLLFYDCETTGLPNWDLPSEHPSQPHIVQLAAVLHDKDRHETGRLNCVIKPDGWELPPFITELTGITPEQVNDAGIPISDAMAAFMALFREAYRTVAHNDSFDRRMMRIELIKLGQQAEADAWKGFPRADCTMKLTTDDCKLRPTPAMIKAKRFGPKPPKLQEAYLHYFGAEPAKSHDAMADVESTIAIYYAYQDRKMGTLV